MADKINCERKARDFTKGPAIFTKYILIKLMNALSECLSQSRALMCLQLQTLPLQGEPIEILSGALEYTRSLQHLSLSSCKIGDDYCEILCRCIKNTTSLLSLDLSNNNLSEKGAASIAQLLKAQEIARYGECWKHSLRYREVPNELIPGLRRVTINNNPEIGDKGLQDIIDVLFDDYWIKAIDMQNCGITDWGCTLIQKLLNIDTEIVIFDVRKNPINDINMIANIVQTLAINSTEDDKGKYGWLDNPTGNYTSAGDSVSSIYSLKTSSVINLSTTKSKNGSQFSGSLVKSFSTPSVPRCPKILAEKLPMMKKQQLEILKRMPKLTTQGIMKNIEKISSITFQDYSLRSNTSKIVQKGPLKAVSQSIVKCTGYNNATKNVPRNKSLPQLHTKCQSVFKTSQGINQPNEQTEYVLTANQLSNIQSRLKKFKTIKAEVCNEENQVKQCKKTAKQYKDNGSSKENSQTNIVNVSKQSSVALNKISTISSEKPEEKVSCIPHRPNSDDSDQEQDICEKSRISHIRDTFKKFLKLQENNSTDL